MSESILADAPQTGTARAETVMTTYLSEVVGKGRLDLIPEFTAADFVDHTQPELRGPDALTAHVQKFCGNIPDLEVEVVHVIANDHAAVGMWRWRGTPTDPIWGVSASGERVRPTVIASLFHFRDGMLVEYRPFVDAVEILGQIAGSSEA